jgi:hypothetical protein
VYDRFFPSTLEKLQQTYDQCIVLPKIFQQSACSAKASLSSKGHDATRALSDIM